MRVDCTREWRWSAVRPGRGKLVAVVGGDGSEVLVAESEVRVIGWLIYEKETGPSLVTWALALSQSGTRGERGWGLAYHPRPRYTQRG